jgi:hypothetical protein
MRAKSIWVWPIVLILSLSLNAQAQTNRLFKSSDLSEVQAFVKTHRKSVFVFGASWLTPDFEQSLLEGVTLKRSSVRVITSASALPKFAALIRAGAQVRYRANEAVSKNGYSNTVALFEDRWLLLKNEREWQLIDSPEAVAQLKSRLEVFWTFCQPAAAR